MLTLAAIPQLSQLPYKLNPPNPLRFHRLFCSHRTKLKQNPRRRSLSPIFAAAEFVATAISLTCQRVDPILYSL
ncbi:hypothetical protein AKJ16_DCAP15925 [Drosera capensis]